MVVSLLQGNITSGNEVIDVVTDRVSSVIYKQR